MAERRDLNLFVLKKSTVQSVDFLIISWLGRWFLTQTLDDEDESKLMQGIREVLDG
jgi:hypothetical protein